MTGKEFKKQMSVLQTMLLTKEHGDRVPQKEWSGFVHIVISCMKDAFVKGESGSGTPDLIAKMDAANNPLADAIASAMRWSYTEGQKARA